MTKRDYELNMLELNITMRYCVDGGFKYITLGKLYSVYNIFGDGGSTIQIMDDNGKLGNYSAKWFEKI